jgi:endoglucanase
MRFSNLLSGAVLAAVAQAQQTAYGQCGGIGWTGQTTCVSGYYCYYNNAYYSQCIPGSGGATTSTKAATTTTKAGTTTTTATSAVAGATGFRWLGVDESGPEFGSGTYPGTYGVTFIFPSLTTLDSLMAEGYNIFRLPFAMERMAPTSLTGPLSAAYLANYTTVVNHITNKGGYAVIDPHNFGRYNGAIITDTVGFGTFWTNLAGTFKSNSHAIFDTNNEYNTEDQTLVLNMNQAAINAIRAVGATSQYIFVEGNAWSGAWTWVATNTNLVALTDPENKIVYEMHQYLDSDGSGTSATCVNNTIGYDRVLSATQWLQQNGKVGIIGEFAGGANSVCLEAVVGMLNYLKANSNVWLGAIWWGGGPWWGSYIYSYEPPSGVAYEYYDATYKTYIP